MQIMQNHCKLTRIFTLVFALSLCGFLFACVDNSDQLQNDLPYEKTQMGANITFLSMYRSTAGYLVNTNARDTLELKNGVPIMVQAFSYSVKDVSKIDKSFLIQDLSEALKNYPFCRYGFKINHHYAAKTELPEDDSSIINMLSGYCKLEDEDDSDINQAKTQPALKAGGYASRYHSKAN